MYPGPPVRRACASIKRSPFNGDIRSCCEIPICPRESFSRRPGRLYILLDVSASPR
jgi:hypothetical protein